MTTRLVLLAAYGTLMTGERNQPHTAIRSRLRPVRPCLIDGTLYEIRENDGGLTPIIYPGLIPGSIATDDVVHGELLEVGADAREARILLRAIDLYENCFPGDSGASTFTRRLLSVRFKEAGETARAWTDVYNRPVDRLRRIAGGRWIAPG